MCGTGLDRRYRVAWGADSNSEKGSRSRAGGRAGIFPSGKSIYLREGWQFRRHFPRPNCSAPVGTVRLSKSFHSALVQCMNCTKGGRDVLCWNLEGTRKGLGHSLTAFVAGYYCNWLAHYCLEVRVSRQLLREVGTTSHCNQTSGTNIMTGSLTGVEVFLFLFLSYDEVLGCPLRFLEPIISISQFFAFAFSVFQEIYSGIFFKYLEIGLCMLEDKRILNLLMMVAFLDPPIF